MGTKEFLGTEVSATFGVNTLQKDLRGYIFNCLEQANMVLPMGCAYDYNAVLSKGLALLVERVNAAHIKVFLGYPTCKGNMCVIGIALLHRSYDVLSFEVPDEKVHVEIIQWFRSCLADRLTELKEE